MGRMTPRRSAIVLPLTFNKPVADLATTGRQVRVLSHQVSDNSADRHVLSHLDPELFLHEHGRVVIHISDVDDDGSRGKLDFFTPN